jgi:ADP-ribose pyrophosphatase
VRRIIAPAARRANKAAAFATLQEPSLTCACRTMADHMNDILDRKVVFSTPWFDIVAKTLAGWESPYYTVEANDYVTVLAATASGGVVLVRQFRPAVEDFTLELPSGHIEEGENPEEAARRELLEETGYTAGKLELLASLALDSGRMGLRQWCYLASELQTARTAHTREPGVEAFELSFSELLNYIRQSKFDHALHLAVVLLWMLRESRGPVTPHAPAGT